MASPVRMVFRRLRRADRYRHPGCLAGLSQPQGLLDGDFIDRIHRHLDVGQFDAGSLTFDADLDVVIDNRPALSAPESSSTSFA